MTASVGSTIAARERCRRGRPTGLPCQASALGHVRWSTPARAGSSWARVSPRRAMARRAGRPGTSFGQRNRVYGTPDAARYLGTPGDHAPRHHDPLHLAARAHRAGPRGRVRLRPHGVRPAAHRSREDLHAVRPAGALPALLGLRRHLRPEHHRRRRQDHRPREGARRRARRARAPLRGRVPPGHGGAREHQRRRLRAGARAHRRDRQPDRAPARRRRRLPRRRRDLLRHLRASRTTASCPGAPTSRPGTRSRASTRTRTSATPATSRSGRRARRATRGGPRRWARAAPAGTSRTRRSPSTSSGRSTTSTAARWT